jgi:hypothetical protein
MKHARLQLVIDRWSLSSDLKFYVFQIETFWQVPTVARNPQVTNSSSIIHLCTQVDLTIILVLFGVKSSMASSFGLKCFLVQEAFYCAPGGGLK